MDRAPPIRIDEVWVGDITYVPLRKPSRFAYLALLMDLFSRRILGWELREAMAEPLVLSALKQAIRSRQPQPGLIHHTDRGGQYAGKAYRGVLRRSAMMQSMSRAANCYDNAFLESCFGTIKTELEMTEYEDADRPQLPVLDIPAAMQKNDTEESIPLLPWFEAVLLETPPEQRTGWVFNPLSLQLRLGRKVQHERPAAEWVGRVVSRIGEAAGIAGEAAGIAVEQADERTGRPIKYATAHDLRRSCGERLRDAGVPPLVICRVMRHSSWETTRKHYVPGDIQRDAEVLREVLGEDHPTR